MKTKNIPNHQTDRQIIKIINLLQFQQGTRTSTLRLYNKVYETEQYCNSTLQTLNVCARVGGTFNRDGH